MNRVLAAWRDDVVTALAFLTRLPPLGRAPTDGGLRRACRTFPLVGAIVGLLAAAALHAALGLGLPLLAAAVLAVAAGVLVTGGLHEDGLADTADGFGGGRDRQAKLAIMRDSHIGTFGVLAVVLAVALKLAALTALPTHAALGALVAAHAGSRAVLPALMRLERPARADGLAVAAGVPFAEAVAWSLGLGALILLASLGIVAGIATAIIAALAAAAAAFLVAWIARRQIGGYTGDVLGAAQQAAEIAVLLAAASRYA
jgi:adenosylcobinamide-GDP ribazoletransferase